MAQLSNEMKAKLTKAQSVEEVAELLKAEAQEMTEEDIQQIWTELTKHREEDERKLSLDELEEVAGGKRDWATKGCSSTVEPGSWCFSSDSCVLFSIVYEHEPTNNYCVQCYNWLYVTEIGGVSYYQCSKCKAYYNFKTLEKVEL